MSNIFNTPSDNINLSQIRAYRGPDGVVRIDEDQLASYNFDGVIPKVTASIAVSEAKEGQLISFDSGSVANFYSIVRVEKQNPDLADPYTGEHTIYYLKDNEVFSSSYSASNTQIVIGYEDWDSKSIGSNGWLITQQGNAIFSNVAVRGDLEATTLDVGGADGIIYNGSAVTIGASVNILAPVTVNSLQVGASPALLRIADNVSGSNSGIFISSANYWYSTGDFSLGGNQGITFGGGSVVIGSGVYINAGVTADSLTVGTTPNLLKISASPNGVAGKDGIYINAYNYWYSDGQFGIGGAAGSARWDGSTLSLTGNINATSGQFTGSISAQHITASTGTIAGFTLANNQLSTASVIVSSSGGLRLGNPTVFSVDQFGNLVATTASITGRINATSGSFSGDITAAAGRFTGSVTVDSGGKFIAGNLSNGVLLDNTGLYGYSGGTEMFKIPTTGSPTLAGFTIINSGLTGSGQNANIIVGNTGSAANSITIRGDKTGGQNAAIYTVQAGVATSSGTGNGFYIDDAGRMRLAGSNGSLTFDGNNLSVTGSISAQHITASNGLVGGWTLSASTLAGTNASIVSTGNIILGTGDNIVRLSSTDATARIWVGNANVFNAPFRVDPAGTLYATGASISGTIIAQSGTFTGSVSAQNITASIGTVGGWNLSASTLTGNSASMFAAGEIRLGSGQTMVAISSTNTNRIWAGSALSTTAPFRVSSQGFLTANGASITGDITAQSGTFTGSISAQSITASVGAVGGFLLSASSLTASNSTTTAVGITTGASAIFAGATARTGTGAKFWVSNAGTLYAQAASVVGDSIINGTNIGNGGGNVPSNLRIGADALLGNTTGSANVAFGDYALRNNRTGIGNVAVGASAIFTSSISSNNVAIGSLAMAGIADFSDVSNNVAVGAYSLYRIRNADFNISIGSSAMFANNYSDSSVAIGHRSMANSQTGQYNVAIGYESLMSGSGDYNISIGNLSLRSNTIGYDNVAIGQAAMYINTTGYENIAIGKYSLRNNNNIGNIAIGKESLFNIDDGFNNIGIGFQALYSSGTGNNGNNNVGVGYQSLLSLTTGDHNVGLGSLALQFISTGSRNIGIGYNAGYGIGTGNDNISIGYESFFAGTTGGSRNVILGTRAFYSNLTGSDNVAIGSSALYSNDSATRNVAVGSDALFSNTTGNSNIAIGDKALFSNTTGFQNIAIGVGALTRIAGTATENIAIGTNAASGLTGGDYNIAIGDTALQKNRQGVQNIAIGSNSFNSATAGSNNTALGAGTLSDMTSGSFNIALGFRAANNHLSGNYNMYLGYEGTALTTSSVIYIGLGDRQFLRVDSDRSLNVFGDLILNKDWTPLPSASYDANYNSAASRNVFYRVHGTMVELRGYFARDTGTIVDGEQLAIVGAPLQPNDIVRVPVTHDSSPWTGRLTIGTGGAITIRTTATTGSAIYVDSVRYFTDNQI